MPLQNRAAPVSAPATSDLFEGLALKPSREAMADGAVLLRGAALPHEAELLQAVEAAADAGYPDFRPDACLINLYEPGSRLRFHGVSDLKDGVHARLGRRRINLTFRRAL